MASNKRRLKIREYQMHNGGEIQHLFTSMIRKGFYDGNALNGTHMCLSLGQARLQGVISRNQLYKAVREIERYLDGYATLSSFLEANSCKSDFRARENIYWNWRSKPNGIGWSTLCAIARKRQEECHEI